VIVLVHGPDAALARDAVAELVRAHDPAGTNTSAFDGKETSLSQIVAAAGSAGFFGVGRVVVVHDLMARARGGKSADDDGAAATPAGAIDLAPLFAAVPPENLLVLVDPGLASVPAAVKKAAPNGVRVVAGDPPRGRDLIGWVVRAATESGGEIDAPAAKLLVESLYPQTWSAKPANPRYDRPPDLDLLRSRVETLVLYAHPAPVNSAHVRALVEGAPDERIFRFVEAASSGDLRVAVAELEELLLAGEEPAKLLAQVFGQVELGVVADAGLRLDPAEIGRQLGLNNPAQMTAIARGRRAARTTGEAAVTSALEIERGFKTGKLRQPTDALLALLVRLAERQEPGAQGGWAPERTPR
jgi:DNA polymerase III delta subunit